tara:strand:- start:1502 stop:2002 length:501 start_codon:yes stop_codon:yes gene_type:complete
MYRKKLLFRNSNATFERDASAVESIWAYLSGSEKPRTTGRFRIRITKMNGEELAAMGLAPDDTPIDFFGIQATLDKWHPDVGWVSLFDWVGNPDDSITKIEKDLTKQFQAFVTGLPIDEDFSFDLPKKPSPVKNTFKTPSKPEPSEPELETPSPEPKEPEPDFEWI